MSIEVRDNPAEGQFEISADGIRAGLASYSVSGDRISLTHTETSPEFAGRGLAKQLITYALDQARARQLSVVPICPYALRVISENQEAYLDLVPADVRARFNLPESS